MVLVNNNEHCIDFVWAWINLRKCTRGRIRQSRMINCKKLFYLPYQHIIIMHVSAKVLCLLTCYNYFLDVTQLVCGKTAAYVRVRECVGSNRMGKNLNSLKSVVASKAFVIYQKTEW